MRGNRFFRIVVSVLFALALSACGGDDSGGSGSGDGSENGKTANNGSAADNSGNGGDKKSNNSSGDQNNGGSNASGPQLSSLSSGQAKYELTGEVQKDISCDSARFVTSAGMGGQGNLTTDKDRIACGLKVRIIVERVTDDSGKPAPLEPGTYPMGLTSVEKMKQKKIFAKVLLDRIVDNGSEWKTTGGQLDLKSVNTENNTAEGTFEAQLVNGDKTISINGAFKAK